jgi:hypothetical protein
VEIVCACGSPAGQALEAWFWVDHAVPVDHWLGCPYGHSPIEFAHGCSGLRGTAWWSRDHRVTGSLDWQALGDQPSREDITQACADLRGRDQV